MKRKNELKRKIEELRSDLREILDAEQKEEAAQYVGRYFKYRNCYSMPEGPEDYWWLYVCITSMDADGGLRSLNFQTDKYGKMTVESDDYQSIPSDGYTEIDEDEFLSAFDEMVGVIAGSRPAARPAKTGDNDK